MRAQVEELGSLLSTGEVPNLFDAGEAVTMGEALRPRARQAKMDGSRGDLWDYGVQQVRCGTRGRGCGCEAGPWRCSCRPGGLRKGHGVGGWGGRFGWIGS